jgi:hypothetical protein
MSSSILARNLFEQNQVDSFDVVFHGVGYDFEHLNAYISCLHIFLK